MKKVIYALHGFLGKPSDWTNVQSRLHDENKDLVFVPVDFSHFHRAFDGFNFWVDEFYQWLDLFEKNNFGNEYIERTLVGYSMGGRLALHLIERKPEVWKGAIFLSTHPGLDNQNEKLSRLENDRRWSEKFKNQNFEETMIEWNNQPALRGSYEPQRHESDYDKNQLSSCLESWSLGLQKDFRLLLDLWDIRQTWVAGGNDKKFSELLKGLPQSEKIQCWVIEGVSHRLLFEAPEEVAHFIVRNILPPMPL